MRREQLGEFAKGSAPWLCLIACSVLVFGPRFMGYASFALDPTVMCDDVRIVHFHFFNWSDPSLFAQDVLGKYHSDGTSDLFRALFFVVAKLGSPYTFTKYAPLVLFPLTLAGMAVAAQRLAGFGAAVVAVALCAGASLMLGRIGGTLPRAFAYPLLAWMAAALVGGNIRSFGALTVLGAGFYPVITVIGGLVLAVLLLVTPAEDRGSASTWTLRTRLAWLLGTAIACALLTAPFVLRMRPYGSAITASMVAEFPEAGVGGRQDSVTRPPFAPLVESWGSVAEQSITTSGDRLVPPLGSLVGTDSQTRRVWFEWIAWFTVGGCLSAGLRGNRGMRRLSAMALATGCAYLLADLVAPRLVVPPRYTLYGVPIITVLAVSSASSGYLPWSALARNRWGVWLGRYMTAVFAALFLALLGGEGHAHPGVARYVKDTNQALFTAISRLPEDSLIAGWPEGAMETMPIASLRTPFLTKELHVPYHTGMTLLMRRRMEALVDAYYAHDLGPLRRLRDEFSVTHLVVEPPRYQQPSQYFKPFGPMIRAAFEDGRSHGFVCLRLRPKAMYDDHRYFILDLSTIE